VGVFFQTLGSAAIYRPGQSIYRLGILGQESHMFQVSPNPLVISVGIIKAKMRGHRHGYSFEKIAHDE
jgi:hypothetical protein